MRLLILQFVTGLALYAGSGALAGSQATAAPQFIDTDDYLDKMVAVIDARQNQIETASILNAMPLQQKKNVAGDLRTRCYFDFGDVQLFRTLVAKGLEGVVVDPTYLDTAGTFTKGHKDAQAIYQSQGLWESAATWYEAKYTQHIILRSYKPSPGTAADEDDSDELHESIHSLALGIGRRDLDEDGFGKDAPEYISDAFFTQQNMLARIEEKALREAAPVVSQLVATAASFPPKAPKDAINAALLPYLKPLHAIAQQYFDEVTYVYKKFVLNKADHSWEMVEELMSQWGGKADWESLVHDTAQNVKVLEHLASSAAQNNAKQDFSPDFMSFFFEKKCMH